jgi:hypothetical protein
MPFIGTNWFNGKNANLYSLKGIIEKLQKV